MKGAKTALVAIVASVICAQKGAGQDPYECNTSTTPTCGGDNVIDALLEAEASVTSRDDCEICETSDNVLTSLAACCVAGAGVSVTSECREISVPVSEETGETFLTVSEVALDASVTIPINISYSETAENACARTCRLYGDPEGLSFCNVRKEFILCDGRIDDADSPDVCTQTEETCLSRKDYYGNACVWLPDDTNDFTWASGSPCQMDPTLPPPVQLVYSRAPSNSENEGTSYAVYATVGERGIITNITFEYDGVSSTINAVDCINSDGSTDGWTNPDAILPYLNVTTVLPGKQVIMDVLLEDMGVHLICQAMALGTARLDIDTLYVTTPRETVLDEGFTEDGFCVTSEMDTGEATQANLTENFHSYCLAKFSQNLLVCRALSKECTRLSFMPTVTEFCTNVAESKLDMSVSKCERKIKAEIQREINSKSSDDVWVVFYCRAIADGSSAVEQECIDNVYNFGFLEVFDETSGVLYNPTASVSCDEDASFEVSTDSCFSGVHVVTVDSNGDRTTIASIPASYLACGDDIVLTGADYPEIFVSGTDIVLQQCGLTDYCSAQNGFREVAAMEVMSEIFITTGSASEIDSLPAVCEVDSSDIVSSCPTQCCLLENDGAPICLNVSVATTPFCTDGSDGNAPDGTSCSDLIGSDAYVDISLELLEDQEDLNWVSTCCQTCAAWGDPKLVAFGGWSESPAEWLMCDGRNPKKSCNFQQKMCTSQTDHLGNDCVWNDTIKDLMDGDRSMVSFYGSPCQPDWAAAEIAGWLPNVTFFTNEDFGVRVFTGERSVLTAMEFNISDTGYHRFDPSGCFDEDSSSAASAWSSYGDAASSPEDDGFSTVCGDIDAGGLERSCAVTHTGSSAFMQFRCIRASHDDEYDGYRLNVQGISEFLPYSATGGFCVSDDLEEYMGESSENEAAASHCGLENDDLGTRLTMGQTCKNIYHPTCTADEAEEAIRKWCRYSAVLPLDDVLSCASDIIDGGSADGMASRWVSRFCAQFPGEVNKCKKDYTAYLDTTPTATMCFSSLDEMVDFGHDPCMVGTKVLDSSSGEEILFIPDHIPPCDNVVRVPATSEYAAFFTSTVEFVKCSVSPSECPLYSALPSTFCDPVRSYSVQLSYSTSSFCGAN